MNRTEQSPEPSMEDILASIRLIISDDAKTAGPAREDRQSRPVASRAEPALPPSLPNEQVLDLTEAVPLPEDLPAADSVEELRATPPAADVKPEAPQKVEIAEAEEEAPPADLPPPEEAQETNQAAQGAPSRTIWSRREPSAAAAPSTPKFEAQARQPQKTWPNDIQMPIPDRGPVSLIPGTTQPQSAEATEDRAQAEPLEIDRAPRLPESLDEKAEATVAAIAENLARSAAGAMDPAELATASRVNFAALSQQQKADVAETFANVIQKENAPHHTAALPTLLDEVLRQYFAREEPEEAEPVRADAPLEEERAEPETASPPESRDQAPEAEWSRFDKRWGAPDFALKSEAHPLPETEPRALPDTLEKPADAPAPQENLPAPAVQLVPKEAEPARYAAASGSPLEDAVRDMLRPLLVQWLDEHMPRILESAIREEIAARGFLPKTQK